MNSADIMINLKRRISEYAIYLSLGMALEVSAYPKPGNVHRLHDFIDIRFEDFIISALASQQFFLRGIIRGRKISKGVKLKKVYGDIIRNIVKESMNISGGGNTNLGTSLLLVPLSIALGYLHDMIERDVALQELITTTLTLLRQVSTVDDAIEYYKVVRIIAPSYIKTTDSTGNLPNVWDPRYAEKIRSNNVRLWDVIMESSKRDLNSREIVQGYSRSIELMLYLHNRLKEHKDWNRAVVETYIYQLSKEEDPVVIRKFGFNVAYKVRKRAEEIIQCIDNWSICKERIINFDEELYNQKINPGSTADLIAVSVSLYAIWKQKDILRYP